MSFSLTQRSLTPKMSQIHEELRVPAGHKQTYLNSFIYIRSIRGREKVLYKGHALLVSLNL